MKLGTIVGKPVYTLPVASSNFVLPYGKVGIEIETENCRVPAIETSGSMWVPHADNSLRNSGVEFVTNGGLIGQEIEQQLRLFCDWATKKKLSEGYPRAGIHIHLDCTDMDMEKGEVANMVGIYLILEHALYQYAGAWRRYCGFCDAMADSKFNMSVLRTILSKGANTNTIVAALRNFDRYAGLNFASLLKYGTIEYRHLRTTYDVNVIFNWINLIFQIKKAAQDWGSRNLLKEFSSLGPVGFGRTVMGPMWPIISPHFNAGEAWAAMENALVLMDKTKRGEIDWGETKPNPLLAAKKGKPEPAKTRAKKVVPNTMNQLQPIVAADIGAAAHAIMERREVLRRNAQALEAQVAEQRRRMFQNLQQPPAPVIRNAEDVWMGVNVDNF